MTNKRLMKECSNALFHCGNGIASVMVFIVEADGKMHSSTIADKGHDKDFIDCIESKFAGILEEMKTQ